MRKFTSLLVFLLFSGIQVAFAQRTVTGRVTAAAENNPLPSVTVVVKGSTSGVLTDADGRFSITVPDNQTVLQFSFIGYTPKEISVGTQTTFAVSLEESVTGLDEVVVTALGIKRESKKLGYAVTSVNTQEMLTNKSTNMMESLVGKISGLNITTPAAGAGASSQIRLRGQAAFNGANNAPLIVINGLPMDQDARGANGGNMRDLGDNMNNINPEDIESMTVLKGATAAAIYGSRAANGAIIITTKSGQGTQGIGVDFSSSLTTQTPLDFYDHMQYEYGLGVNGARPTAANTAGNGQYSFGAKHDGLDFPLFDGTTAPYSANPGNLLKYYRTGQIFSNTLAFSGGNDKGSFRASFSNSDAKGIDPYNTYTKKTANLGVNYAITEKVRFTMNVNYANEIYINPPELGTQGPGAVNFFTRLSASIPYEAFVRSATNPATGTESVTSGFQGTILNPIYAYGVAGQRYENIRDRFLGTATLRYDITDWLYAQGRLNYDYSVNFSDNKTPGGIATSIPTNTADGTYKGSYATNEGQGTDINADFLLGATKRFGKLSFDASVGGNTYRVKDRSFNVSASNFIVRDFFSIANGTVKNQGYDFSQRRVNSLYGMAEFGWNSMLYLNFTGREDWFSVLNPMNNSKFYPSVSGSFIFSELLKNQTWLTYAKLRGSWAQVGSANGVGVYEGNLTYGIGNNQFNGQTTASISGNSAPNPNLQPFTVTEKEIGLEARLFDNKVRIDIAAFDKVTTDQVLSVILSGTSGYSSSKQNLGSLKNSGIETMIEFTPIETSNFRWTTSWNNTYLTTEVLSVGFNPDGSPIKDFLLMHFNTGNEFLGELHYTVGMAMNQLYVKSYARNADGEILVQSNGRLKATADYLPIGSSIPKFTGGWNNTFSYKNLSVGAFIDYKLGGMVMSATNLNLTRQGMTEFSLMGRMEGENGIVFPGINEGTGEANTVAVTNLQSFYADYRNLQIGDPFVFKSDFVKLRSVSVSYNFIDEINRLAFLGFVKGLTLTASCRNVAILHKDIINLDPEAVQSSGDQRAGYENAALPTTRNYMFTLNVKF